MNLDLSKKTVLITGASSGIGAATAMAFAQEGADLLLVARNLQKLQSIQELIISETKKPLESVQLLICDLENHDAINDLAKQTGPVDILVNNAGAIPSGGLMDVSAQAWIQGWQSKVFAYINMSRAYYPLMKSQGHGVMVNVLGNGSQMKRSDYLCGGMGNAALDFFTQTLGASSPDDNIRVLGISPGPVDTERYRKIAKERIAKLGVARKYPFDRIAKPEEIARMIVFMSSSQAGYVSGAIVTVDGGISVSKK
jgi:NAD(P)-dependent dehydrogenase (short-subunit alcohol dehydrogenase family)